MELSNALEHAISNAHESAVDVEVESCTGSSGEDAFLSIYGALTTRLGIPDFPGGLPEFDWRTELRLDCRLLAVWDFDYYQLSLRLEGKRVLLRRHSIEPAN